MDGRIGNKTCILIAIKVGLVLLVSVPHYRWMIIAGETTMFFEAARTIVGEAIGVTAENRCW